MKENFVTPNPKKNQGAAILWLLLALLACAALGLAVWFALRDGSGGSGTMTPSVTPTVAAPTPTAAVTEPPIPTEPAVTPTPEPTEEPVPTATPTPTAEPTATPTEAPTPTEEAVPTQEPTPTEEPTATPTLTEEPEPTATPTEAPTATPTEEPTATPTEAPTATPTVEPSATPTNTPKPTPTNTPKPTPTNTPKPTKAPTPTNTPKPTATPTKKPTPTNTPKPTPKPTKAPTPTNTPKPAKTKTMWLGPEQILEIWVLENGKMVDLKDNGGLRQGDKVTVVVFDYWGEGDEWDPVDGIQLSDGRIGYLRRSCLSDTYVEPKWDAPRERKDIADLLMAKVQAYRKSKGLRQWEDPYVYYEVNKPGLGDRLNEKGLRVAKASCLAKTSTHEGGQIGVGWYGPDERPSAEKVAEVLYKGWYDSPGHNANMLDDHSKVGSGYIDVAVMTVVEYYDGTYYNYCAIMTSTDVLTTVLPDGLK